MKALEAFVNGLSPNFVGSAILLGGIILLAMSFYSPRGRSPIVGMGTYFKASRPVISFWAAFLAGALAVAGLFYFTYTIPAALVAEADGKWESMGNRMCKVVPGCVDFYWTFGYDQTGRAYATHIKIMTKFDTPDVSGVQKIYEDQISELSWAQHLMMADIVEIEIAKAAPKAKKVRKAK